MTDVFHGETVGLQATRSTRAWLQRCLSPEQRAAGETELLQRVAGDRANALDGHGALVRRALDLVGDVRVPRTVVHGDFVPWNMVMEHGALRVFDWEYGSMDGVPEWDRLFFVSQVGVTRQGWTSTQLARRLAGEISAGSPHYGPSPYRGVAALVLLDLAARSIGLQRADSAEVYRQGAAAILDGAV
jgi:hypothetical protein